MTDLMENIRETVLKAIVDAKQELNINDDYRWRVIKQVTLKNRVWNISVIICCFIIGITALFFFRPAVIYDPREAMRKDAELAACNKLCNAYKDLVKQQDENILSLKRKQKSDSLISTELDDFIQFRRDYRIALKNINSKPTFHHKKQKQ